MRLNHSGPDQPLNPSDGYDAEVLVQDLAKDHVGLLPLFVGSQQEADYLQGLGLMHGTEVEVYVWGTPFANDFTDSNKQMFYTYLEGVIPCSSPPTASVPAGPSMQEKGI